jgi:hypothetical protein
LIPRISISLKTINKLAISPELKHMHKTIFLWITLSSCFGVFAQQTEAQDSTNIISFVDKIILKVNVDT